MPKTISLNHGMVAIVDDDDFEWLSCWKWRAIHSYRSQWHAYRREDNKLVRMHRAILNAPAGSYVDHRNGNCLDNQRCNLRLCDNRRNQWNSRPRHWTRYKGVRLHQHSGRWHARIGLGSFATAEEAARAYDKAARLLCGEFAFLNFPNEE